MHGEVFKDRTRNSATFKMGLFETIGEVKSSKGLHLISAHNFYVSHHYIPSILIFNINMKYKQIFKEATKL